MPAFRLADGDRLYSTYSIQGVVDHTMDVGFLGNRIVTGNVKVSQWVNAQVFAGVQQVKSMHVR